MIPKFLCFLSVLTCLLYPSQGHAQKDPAQINCVAVKESQNSHHFQCTLHLDAGWKTIAMDKENPVTITLPSPATLDPLPPLQTLSTPLGAVKGYEKEMTFSFQRPATSQPFDIHGQVETTLCADLCLPLSLPFTVSNETPFEDAGEAFWLIALFAILGGLILNFMPCVLPVLSLKIMSIAKRSKEARKDVHHRASFAATFAGIMVSFWTLAALTIFLDKAGSQVGWGLHFQQPSFLSFMIVLVTLFACSLWGFFEILLPSGAQNFLHSLTGGRFKNAPVLVEDFLGGVLATLLATPCTAPFLGTAVGYAFIHPAPEIFIIFSLMGVGFGIPYIIGMLLPFQALKLPKPGRWMRTMSKTLALVLGLTALWLLAVLMAHHWLMAAVLAVICLGMVFFFARAYRHQIKRHWAFWLALLGVFTPLLTKIPLYEEVAPLESSRYWRPLASDHIGSLVQQGQVVIVNVTARWCLTCQLNEQRVFHSAEGKRLLTQPHVVAMQGDWTKKDATIYAFLAAHDRRGIPFTAVFGPGAPEGLVLSELLSLEELQEVLEKAARPAL